MTFKIKLQKISITKLLLFLAFQNALQAGQAQQLQKIANVLKEIASGSQMLTPPAMPIAATINSWGSTPTDAFVVTGSIPPASNMQTLVDLRQKGLPIACQGGLQFINVGLDGAANQGGWWCEFNVAASPILQQLAQQGLYVAVTTLQQSGRDSTVVVSLTDVSGNLFATASTVLPAGQGFSWINIGYNKNTPVGNPLQPKQVYVNWIPLTANTPIASWYQDQGTATAVSTPSIGGQVVPTPAKSVVSTIPAMLTPPTTPMVPANGITSWGMATDAFVVTGNIPPTSNMQTLVDSRQKGAAIACQGGLQFINIGLNGAQNQGGWWCEFNVATSPMLQKLSQQGLYVVVTTLQQSGNNTVVVSLTDLLGNVFATTSTVLPAGQGFSWINIGYNKNNPTAANQLKPNQVYVNWIPLTANTPIASWYQDQGTATAVSTPSIGGQVVPSTVSTQLSIPQAPAAWSNAVPPASMCSAPFIPTQNFLVGNILNNSPLNCPSGLNFINVGLTDSTQTNYLAFTFQIVSNSSLVILAAKGLYVACGMVVIDGVNNAQVALTDVSGNVYSVINFALPAGVGFTQANIGFNSNDTLAVPQPANSVAQNYVPLGQRVYYLQTLPAAQQVNNNWHFKQAGAF